MDWHGAGATEEEHSEHRQREIDIAENKSCRGEAVPFIAGSADLTARDVTENDGCDERRRDDELNDAADESGDCQ